MMDDDDDDDDDERGAVRAVIGTVSVTSISLLS
jgi:hypothetical protein